jgi:hypothetical protein
VCVCVVVNVNVNVCVHTARKLHQKKERSDAQNVKRRERAYD